jgi:hypothetical protein
LVNFFFNSKLRLSAQQKSCIPLFSEKIIGTSKLSPYDARVAYKDADYAQPIRVYLDRSEVRTALGIHGSSVYHNCDNSTYYAFVPEFHQSVPETLIPQILASSTRILLFGIHFLTHIQL